MSRVASDSLSEPVNGLRDLKQRRGDDLGRPDFGPARAVQRRPGRRRVSYHPMALHRSSSLLSLAASAAA